MDAGSITNTASAAATPPQGPPVTGTDSTTVVIATAPHLTLTKTPSVFTVTNAGDPITYTVNVTNDGDVTLNSVVVTDPHCPLVLPPSGDTTNPGFLDVGETWTYTCTYNATQADIDNGTITNTATADAKDPHGTDVTGSDTAVVTRSDLPNLEVTKTPSVPIVFAAGDTITYSIDVTNTGNLTPTAHPPSSPVTTRSSACSTWARRGTTSARTPSRRRTSMPARSRTRPPPAPSTPTVTPYPIPARPP
jgi:hypothetical protein